MKSYQNSHNYIKLFWTFLLMWVGLLTWAFLFEVNKSVTVRGSMQPFGNSFAVESSRDGKIVGVEALLGERVREGQIIIKLDTEVDLLNREALQKQIILAQLKHERFKALVEGEEQLPQTLATHSSQWLVENNNLKAALDALNSEIAIVDKEIQISRARISNIEATIKAALGQQELLERQQKLILSLYEKGFEGELSVLEIAVKLESFDEQIRSLRNGIREESLKIETFNKRLESIRANFRNQAQKGLYDASVEVAQLRERALAVQAKIDKSSLAAPVDGRVSKFVKNNLGQFVKTGETVAAIVPDAVPLMLYVRIPVEHISNVELQQDAKVTLDNMDSRNTNKLMGKLIQVDGDATVLENGGSFFSGVIEVKDVPDKYSIPGVDGTASLLVGKQSVISYFLEPVMATLQNSMSE